MTHLDLQGPLPTGRLVVEASAGTGKTYSLSALVVRHVAERGLPASSLLIVTFTRAAAADLRDRTRRALRTAQQAFEVGVAPPDMPWMSVLLANDEGLAQRQAHVRNAVQSFDEATVTTIHGFCQQALRQLGLRSGTGLEAELGDGNAHLVDEVCRDLVVAELVHDPEALQIGKDSSPNKVLNNLKKAVTAALGNPGAVLVPQPGTVTGVKPGSLPHVERWVQLVHQAVHEVARRRELRQELGYDDLVTSLRDAVLDPQVAAQLNERYQLVMVDEFQDTDPVQWEIFQLAFGTNHLVTVGDPKQAIYRFRGADVEAYLRATQGANRVQLSTNWRSDAPLVQATNALVHDVWLGGPQIVGSSVSAAHEGPSRLGLAPLEVRTVPFHSSLRTVNKKGELSKALSAPLVRRPLVTDIAREVVELLQHGHIQHGDGQRRVEPGHIAILVPSHSIAEEVVRGLQRAGVPSVRTRTGSVLTTRAAVEWLLLLAAMERPSYAPTVRAVAMGVFFQRPAAELDPLEPGADERLAELQRQCAAWADHLSRVPFLAWYDRVRSESRLVPTLLGGGGGERELTDLDHIAELLAVELPGNGTTAASARRTLEWLRDEASKDEEIDAQMRRIDSDAQAVQITTLHGSKGLEYPVVLLPFAWQTPNGRTPYVYNHATTRDRTVDIASWHGWVGEPADNDDFRKHLRDVGDRGDRLRLLYVGLTRAEHRTVVWWAPGDTAAKSALNVVLFDRGPDGQPLHTEPVTGAKPKGGWSKGRGDVASPSDEQAAEVLATLGQSAGGHLVHRVMPVQQPRPVWTPDADTIPSGPLSAAESGGRVLADPAWRRWSFTAITRTRDQAWAAAPPVVGGNDEGPDPADAAAPVQSPAHSASGSPEPSPVAITVPLADVVAGADFGTLVHSVLEQVDPAHSDLHQVLSAEVERQLRRDRLDVPPAVLTEGLAAALRTPLGPIADGLSLAEISAANRLAELDFDLPLAESLPRISAPQIGEVLLHTLAADDPQLPYARTLADGRFDVHLAGFLQGSIDAVLRVADPACGHRYLVVDYKTNKLHRTGDAQPLAAYHPHHLPEAMAHHDYPLQALLYSVALHRYLRWRLPGYQPELHLGGIAYLFVRGMVGPHTPVVDGTPHGVFAWRPPAATVVGLHHLLATGEVA